MLKFANLSFAQKKCVVALIEHTPSLKKTGKVTLKDVVFITQDLAKKRSEGAPKIGYPNWLFKTNKLERGVYQLPVPTDAELSAYTKEANDKSTPKVAKAKAKVAKVQKAKTIKVKKQDSGDELLQTTRLEKIINDSHDVDADVEDFNAILRENGIEV